MDPYMEHHNIIQINGNQAGNPHIRNPRNKMIKCHMSVLSQNIMSKSKSKCHCNRKIKHNEYNFIDYLYYYN